MYMCVGLLYYICDAVDKQPRAAHLVKCECPPNLALGMVMGIAGLQKEHYKYAFSIIYILVYSYMYKVIFLASLHRPRERVRRDTNHAQRPPSKTFFFLISDHVAHIHLLINFNLYPHKLYKLVIYYNKTYIYIFRGARSDRSSRRAMPFELRKHAITPICICKRDTRSAR